MMHGWDGSGCYECFVCLRDMRLARHDPDYRVFVAAVERGNQHLADHDTARRAARAAFWRGFLQGMDVRTIALSPKQLDVLRWHVETQLEHAKAPAAMRESDLLFPAAPTRHGKGGGFRSGSCLDKPFKDIARRIGLSYKVSAREMRRTYQDLQRAAETADIVTRSISGHVTEEMQRAYSTVSPDEQREAMGKVFDIATGREMKAAPTKRGRRAA